MSQAMSGWWQSMDLKPCLCIVGCLWLAISLHCSSSMAQCTSPLTYTWSLFCMVRVQLYFIHAYFSSSYSNTRLEMRTRENFRKGAEVYYPHITFPSVEHGFVYVYRY